MEDIKENLEYQRNILPKLELDWKSRYPRSGENNLDK